MNKYLYTIIFYFLAMVTSFASVGFADGPVKEYGLGIYGWYLLFIILIVVCSIQLIRIIYFFFTKKTKKVIKLLKLTLIGVIASITLTYLFPKVNKLIQGDYIIFNQSQLDELGSKKKTIIRGDLLIAQVNNLSSLNTIEKINGDLILSFEHNDCPYDNKNLRTLNGLNNIKSIGGDLIIKQTSLTNLNGLDSLSNIKGEIVISYNRSLSDYCQILKIENFNKISVFRNKVNPNMEEIIKDCH
ncbi:hypothetical protein [Wenyingzhuangia sp. IMCC45574]